MNWIRPAKRLAIYLRDGLACCYCGASVEDGVRLTLDHLRCYSTGGSHDATNIITSCHTCNSRRGTRPWKQFATAVALYLNHGVTAEHIIAHVGKVRRRKLDIAAAKSLLALRGGFTAAVQSAATTSISRGARTSV